MTIDKEKLIRLLQDKTGLEREDVVSQLTELISKIQKAAEEGKTFEIEGFGTFGLAGGTLHFEPSDTLETEINNKYAGMKPIEMIGAFKEPDLDKEVPDMERSEIKQEDDKWIFDSDLEREEARQPGTDEAPSSEKDKKEPIRAEDLQRSADKKDADAVFDAVFGTGVVDQETESAPVPNREEDKRPPNKPEESTTHEAESEDNSEKDALGTILVAAVVVIALGVGGWITYDMMFSASSRDQSVATASQSDQQNNQLVVQQQPVDEKEPDETMEPKQSTEVPTQEASDDQINNQQNQYGLHGSLNKALNSGYTIVVHSLRDADKAERNRQSLQEDGYRAIISQAQVQGTTYYRVGLGQFETVGDAQRAIEEIPEQFRENNFIKRIQ